MPRKTSKSPSQATNQKTFFPLLLIGNLFIIILIYGLMFFWQKAKLMDLEQRVADLETQNKYLQDINKGAICLNPEPPEIIGNKLKLNLYYYNKNIDRQIADYLPCIAVTAVEREIPLTSTPIKDAIELLIKGELTSQEIAQGFETEFPHPDFKLLDMDLTDDVLTLTFTEVPGFTIGGSCRVGILSKQIILTAKQFPEVAEVRFQPESIFQP